METKVVISLDTQSLENPNLFGLHDVSLNYPWLRVFTNANNFREYIKNHNEKFEIWVLSSDDIEAINLAAAIKKDRADCVVCLICFGMSGSLKSRSSAAHIDTILNIESLNERIEAYQKKFKLESSSKEKVRTNDFELNKVPKISQNTFNNKNSFILSVLSASGGAGKSYVSAMCGILLKNAGLKTLIIDADFQFGDISELMPIKDVISIDDVLNDNSKISLLKSSKNMPCILASSNYPEYNEKINVEFPSLLDKLSKLFDVIIVNTGSLWGEQQAILLEHDSKSLFLIDQRPSSINATKKAISLCERCGIATGSVVYTINKCSKQSLFSSIDISCALNGANVAEIMDGGLEVDEAFTSQNPLKLINTKNSFAVSVWILLENIIPKNIMENISANSEKNKSSENNKKWSWFSRKRRA